MTNHQLKNRFFSTSYKNRQRLSIVLQSHGPSKIRRLRSVFKDVLDTRIGHHTKVALEAPGTMEPVRPGELQDPM